MIKSGSLKSLLIFIKKERYLNLLIVAIEMWHHYGAFKCKTDNNVKITYVMI